jgi:tetratricopeptide (TPR) repeat protein
MAPIYIFLALYAVTVLAFFITARYRMPMIPFLIILASAGGVELWRGFLSKAVRPTALGLAIIILLAALTNRAYFDEGFSKAFQNIYNYGIALERQGDYAEAEDAYRRAIRQFPNSGTAYNSLGYIQLAQGKLGEAETSLRQGMKYEPRNPRLYKNLAAVYQSRNHLDSALMYYMEAARLVARSNIPPDERGLYFLNLAVIYDAMGRVDSAAAWYLRTATAEPDFAATYGKAGGFFARTGQPALADSLFQLGESRQALSTNDQFNWGLALLHLHRTEEGRDRLHTVIAADSTNFQAWYLIAASFEEQGGPVDSMWRYLSRSLAINPAYQPAIRLHEAVSGGR